MAQKPTPCPFLVFLVLHLVTPKDIATKMGNFVSG